MDGGYSGAASASSSQTAGIQLRHGDKSSTRGFVLPAWAAPIAIVGVFVVAIVWLLRKD